MIAPIAIRNRRVGPDQPTHFIADIAANHDGSLNRALGLMTLANKAGADCVKSQDFRAARIVSDYAFKALGGQKSHQATWSKSVFDTCADASRPREWTAPLVKHAEANGVEFMSAPYSLETVAYLNPFVNVFKVGSGDVNWLEELSAIASLGKAVLIATGALTFDEVERALDVLLAAGVPIVLVQCNTSFTCSIENAHHANLRVISQYAREYLGVTLGLSDHTPGHMTVLGAVALGARRVEKHFTDHTGRDGPDHRFSIDSVTCRAMVDDTRLLEATLGTGVKPVEENEAQTVVLQRHCVRAASALPAGHVLTRADLEVLRPASAVAVPAHNVAYIVGRSLTRSLAAGQEVAWNDLARSRTSGCTREIKPPTGERRNSWTANSHPRDTLSTARLTTRALKAKVRLGCTSPLRSTGRTRHLRSYWNLDLVPASTCPITAWRDRPSSSHWIRRLHSSRAPVGLTSPRRCSRRQPKRSRSRRRPSTGLSQRAYLLTWTTQSAHVWR